MTDKEIKKALECCFNIPFADCSYCPLRKYDTCLKKLPKLALDLINRQQATIDKGVEALFKKEETTQLIAQERQQYYDELQTAKAKIELLKKGIGYKRNQIDGLTKLLKRADEIKAEAIKEFAEAVKMEFYKEFDEIIPSIMAEKIDNLVKNGG